MSGLAPYDYGPDPAGAECLPVCFRVVAAVGELQTRPASWPSDGAGPGGKAPTYAAIAEEDPLDVANPEAPAKEFWARAVTLVPLKGDQH